MLPLKQCFWLKSPFMITLLESTDSHKQFILMGNPLAWISTVPEQHLYNSIYTTVLLVMVKYEKISTHLLAYCSQVEARSSITLSPTLMMLVHGEEQNERGEIIY